MRIWVINLWNLSCFGSDAQTFILKSLCLEIIDSISFSRVLLDSRVMEQIVYPVFYLKDKIPIIWSSCISLLRLERKGGKIQVHELRSTEPVLWTCYTCFERFPHHSVMECLVPFSFILLVFQITNLKVEKVYVMVLEAGHQFKIRTLKQKCYELKKQIAITSFYHKQYL